MLHSFAPVVDSKTEILILGSLPGVASLEASQYYAHPQNAFWRIMGILLGDESFARRAYRERLDIMLSKHFGLWDSIGAANRRGSLDQAIKDVQTNPLVECVEKLPALKLIAFNGKTAEKFGTRALKKLSRPARTLTLPSTSPANTMKFELKLEAWKNILFFCGKKSFNNE
jgi:hypoxanthine-DNA glycosylase